ncbi:MAG: hypothetical protein ABEH65_07215 [Halobacteriales archaeon]
MPPAKVTGSATDYREIDRWTDGVGWIAHPEEIMRRASHALRTDEGVWIVDPVDAAGVEELIAEFGEVAGIVILSNQHRRDADVFADRYNVPVFLPAPMEDVAAELDAPIEWIEPGDQLGEYELIEVAISTVLGADWFEYSLYDGETLLVGESLGTAPYLRVDDERLGVMLLRRLDPPRDTLGDLTPERVLGGHGAGVQEDAAAALEDALTNSRRHFPRALVENGLSQLRTVLAAIRT